VFCENTESLAFIDYRYLTAEPADTTCLIDRGATRIRVRQRGRGGGADVWLIPASDAPLTRVP
jgi:hypothetical protein